MFANSVQVYFFILLIRHPFEWCLYKAKKKCLCGNYKIFLLTDFFFPLLNGYVNHEWISTFHHNTIRWLRIFSRRRWRSYPNRCYKSLWHKSTQTGRKMRLPQQCIRQFFYGLLNLKVILSRWHLQYRRRKFKRRN